MKELEDKYFEGFVKGFWDLESISKGQVLFLDIGEEVDKFNEEINSLECFKYGEVLDHETCFETEELQNALKRWKEFESSPLYQALL